MAKGPTPRISLRTNTYTYPPILVGEKYIACMIPGNLGAGPLVNITKYAKMTKFVLLIPEKQQIMEQY